MKFSKEHEWVEVDNDIAIVGISKYAVEQLGDITFIELPEIGATVNVKDSVAFIESVKTASDIYTPLSGTIYKINDSLEQNPDNLNIDPEDFKKNWIFKIKISNQDELNELMDSDTYKNYIKTL